MGRQIHPRGFRLGISTAWDSQWYGLQRKQRQGQDWNHEMEKLRELIRVLLHNENCLIGRIHMEFQPLLFQIHVSILSSNNNDEKFNQVSKKIIRVLKRSNQLRYGTKIHIQFHQASWDEMDALLIGEWIVLELEKGTPFRPIKKTIQEWFQDKEAKKEIEGIRVQIKGRIQGAEIANKEWFCLGKVSLQTITNPVDYAETRAYTLSGVLGVKIWLV